MIVTFIGYVNCVFNFLDRCLFGKPSIYLSQAMKEVDVTLRYSRENKEEINTLYALLDAIDNKTGALLTHISLLIAMLAILYQSGISNTAKTLVLLEMLIYIILTFLCLRSIRMTAPWSPPEEQYVATQTPPSEAELTRIKLEYWKRRECYNLAAASTIVATSALVIVLLSFIFFG